MITLKALESKLFRYIHIFPSSYNSFAIALTLTLFTVFLLYIVISYILRPLFRRADHPLALMILNVSQNPLVLITTFVGTRFSFEKLHSSLFIDWTKRSLKAGIIITITYLVSQLFTDLITYYLRNYAKQTEAVWDNVLVPILQKLLPILTYLLGAFLFLETIGIDLTGIWVAFGGLTFVLGFGLRDILANFFSGLVLLIDTPFQFGDVITIDNDSMAVIKNIGLRVTKLYLVDKDSEVYIPNASLVSKDIINLTRPTPHFSTTIEVDVKSDTNPLQATEILRQSVLSHPDTLGNITDKLKYMEDCQGLKEAEDGKLSKKEAGKIRLLAEQKVNEKLQQIESGFEFLITAIKIVKAGGLEEEQVKDVQRYYKEIIENIGLHQDKNKENSNNHLMELIRHWYKAWNKDPDLRLEDRVILEDEWETKLCLLITKVNRLSPKIAKPEAYETRLDEYIFNILQWLKTDFKASTNVWKEPIIRLGNLTGDSMKFTTRLYVDNIKLENCQRGYRVANEVRREMVRRLAEAKIYKE